MGLNSELIYVLKEKSKAEDMHKVDKLKIMKYGFCCKVSNG